MTGVNCLISKGFNGTIPLLHLSTFGIVLVFTINVQSDTLDNCNLQSDDGLSCGVLLQQGREIRQKPII